MMAVIACRTVKFGYVWCSIQRNVFGGQQRYHFEFLLQLLQQGLCLFKSQKLWSLTTLKMTSVWVLEPLFKDKPEEIFECHSGYKRFILSGTRVNLFLYKATKTDNFSIHIIQRFFLRRAHPEENLLLSWSSCQDMQDFSRAFLFLCICKWGHTRV